MTLNKLEKSVSKCGDMRIFIADIFISTLKIKLNEYFQAFFQNICFVLFFKKPCFCIHC